MYQIRCDDYVLYDPRDEELIVLNPKCKLKENTVGEGSFTILSNHPYYCKLKKLKSVFEIRQDGHPIFRGRMTGDSRDFNNRLDVDLEGVLGFTNDTLIPPFNFPADFPEAENSPNVVEYFLGWILNRHNERVSDWQKLRLGNVTVSDPNNYLSRSSDKYASTWETLKTKLFDSALGGYLTIRYEADGNYVDYVDSYELTNIQRITLGENLLDIKNESDASETYSAILPVGKDGLTLANVSDGDITDDLVKDGLYIYSRSAVDEYGWICAPIEETTWDDVTLTSNLRSKAVAYLGGGALLLSATITIKAVDLHFSDEEIQSFRVYRNILVDSPIHGITSAVYRLSELDIDLMNPQNTVITIGDSFRSLVDVNDNKIVNVVNRIESATNDLKDRVSNTQNSVAGLRSEVEGLDGLFFYIKYSAYADGHIMTDTPQADTQYMGTCSAKLKQDVAPTDYRKYTWCKIKGVGVNSAINYYLASASNSGITTSTSGWTETVQDVSLEKKYLWNYEKVLYTDGNEVCTEPCIIGVYGDTGNGIESITEYYALSTSNSVVPTSWSNSVPTMTATNKYLWNYEKIKYTNSEEVDTNPYIIGVYGDKGIQGEKGEDGKTQYLHIKYSDDGKTFTANNGETLGAYIGTLVDFDELDSTNFNDYTWKKFTEDVDEELGNIRQTILDQSTSISNTAEAIVSEALKSYVEITEYGVFKESVKSSFTETAEEISMKFQKTTEQIEDVGGDLQKKFEQVYKYIDFSQETAITIGSGNNSIVLEVDNEKGILFKKNGVAFGRWDGNNFYTGNIVVEVNERAQLGNFAFIPRSDGSLSFLKVG